MVKGNMKKVNWEFTDDVIAILLVIAWLACYALNKPLPEWVLTTVLGYVFGKHMPIK